MDTAKQHWEILRQVPEELANRVRDFMVIGKNGEGVILLTENGDGYWLGEMRFGDSKEESKQTIEPIKLDVPNLASMAQGYRHILLLNESGQIHAMGKNHKGQLGLGTVDQKTHFTPKLISIPLQFTSIRCGQWHSVALTEDGKVWAWGGNYWGQVGVLSSTVDLHPSPHQISQLNPHRVIAVECGGTISLALTIVGDVYAWGWNNLERFGYTNESIIIPTKISTPSPVKSMAAGYEHTLLLTQTEEVYACGRNNKGQLGISTTTESSGSLVKVSGLPSISQIASHFSTSLSIAMSIDQRCFAWGCLNDKTSTSTPLLLSPIYSTLDSVLSLHSNPHNTSHSVRLEGPESDSKTETKSLTRPIRLEKRIARMFDNPNSKPDVKFVLGELAILAHRSVLQISSDYFLQFFSDNSSSVDPNPLSPICQSSSAHPNPPSQISQSSSADPNPPSSISQSSSADPNPPSQISQSSSADPNTPSPICQSSPKPHRHTTNPSELNLQRHTTNPSEPDLQTPLITIPIPDYSYPTFYAYLRFLYTDTLQVPDEHLAELFDLAHFYLESDLKELCLVRMRSTISLENCCLYYQLTERHSLPEFQHDLFQFIADNISQIFLTDAYRSLDGDLCKKLAISIGNFRL